MSKNVVQLILGILSIILLFRLWFLALQALWDKIEQVFSKHGNNP